MFENVLLIVLFAIGIVSMFAFSLIKPRLRIAKAEIQTFWIVPLIMSIVVLLTVINSPKELFKSLTSDASINPIKILVLFFSMTFISTVLDEAGFFSYLATKAANKAKGSQFKLFIVIYLLISALTIFTSNDVIVITFTPFIIFFTRKAKINPVPYLFMEFVAANTWSMLFIIGNPTNIYLGGMFDISFIEYLSKMFLPTIFASLVSFVLLILLFKKKLSEPINCDNHEINPIKNKVICFSSLIVLLTTLIFMVISDFINIDMWLISLVGALLLLVFIIIYSIKKKNGKELFDATKRLPYGVIPFILSMFIFVYALTQNGFAELYATLINKLPIEFGYGLFGLLSANIINNIPMSVFFSEIVKFAPTTNQNFALYSSIIASNIGAFLTPFGALAGIMFMSIIKKENVKFRFIDFIKYGSITGILSLCAALLGLVIIL